MDKFEAERLVKAYGGAIANSPGPFRNISSLPCPKAMLKHAFFVYIETIIKEYGGLSDEVGQPLVATYCMLSGFVSDEEVIELNKVKDKIMSKSNDYRKKYTNKLVNAIRDAELFDEINEFIGECYKKYGVT